MGRLKGAKPRRYRDHRRKEAKRWGKDYDAIAERHPPGDRLGRELVALAADQLADYKALRLSRRASPSSRRKAAGLFLGALRAAAAGGGNGHEPGQDLSDAIAQLNREDEA